MTRKCVEVTKTKKFRCPICSHQSGSLRGIAQHLAMSRDEVHRAWRREHGLPEDYETMGEAMEMARRILEILKPS